MRLLYLPQLAVLRCPTESIADAITNNSVFDNSVFDNAIADNAVADTVTDPVTDPVTDDLTDSVAFSVTDNTISDTVSVSITYVTHALADSTTVANKRSNELFFISIEHPHAGVLPV